MNIEFNMEMFEEMARRWAVVWTKQPSWDPAHKNKLFKEIWNSFYSKIDAENGTITEPLSMVKYRNRIIKEFHL